MRFKTFGSQLIHLEKYLIPPSIFTLLGYKVSPKLLVLAAGYHINTGLQHLAQKPHVGMCSEECLWDSTLALLSQYRHP